MIPAGYLLKRIAPPPDWLSKAPIADVCCVAACVQDDVVDVQLNWMHNGFGLANDPQTLLTLAAEAGVDPADATLFYYEAYEEELGSDGWKFDPDGWQPVTALDSSSVETTVAPPTPAPTLLGYDVAVSESFLAHSPLACNHIAETVEVNAHCLFDTLEDARAAINGGVFGGGCEPGVYRIYSVHALPGVPA